MRQKCLNVWTALTRRKTIDLNTLTDNKLKRKLNLIDLLGIGIGGSVGIGVFAILPFIIRNEAGPSSVISVSVAALAAILSGLCFSEMAMRIPKSGSSYMFTYATLGELCGFIVGWNILLEHVLGTAIAAKTWSQYFDHLLNGTIHRYFETDTNCLATTFPIRCPDVLGLAPIVLSALILAVDVKLTSAVIFILTVVSVFVSFCVMCVGFFHVKHDNWTDPPGFFPYGVQGTLCGTSLLFYAISSSDRILSASEETKDPMKSVSSGVCFSLALSSVMIFCVSLALTLSTAWSSLPENVVIPIIFEEKGIAGAKALITVGGILALTVACLCAMFSTVRLLYSISTDGLFFVPFKRINKVTGTPLFTTGMAFVISSLVMLALSLECLILMISISSLISGIIVSACVVCLRYQQYSVGLHQEYEDLGVDKAMPCNEIFYASFPRDSLLYENAIISKQLPLDDTSSPNPPLMYGSFSGCCSYGTAPRGNTYRKMDSIVNNTPSGSYSSLLPLPVCQNTDPTHASSIKANYSLLVYIVASVGLAVSVDLEECCWNALSWWKITSLVIATAIIVISFIVIVRQPQNRTKLIFKTPYVPAVPLLSITLISIILASVPQEGWIRFAVGLGTGLLVYLTYGMGHSTENVLDEQEVRLHEITDT